MVPDPASRLLDAPAQAERTALAWQRTGLGVVGMGAALAHTNQAAGQSWRLVPGLTLLVVGVVLFSVATLIRYRRITDRVASGGDPVAPRALATLAVLVSTTAVMAAGLLCV